MSTATITLQKSFFDDLWPLILWENRCDTRSKRTAQYFVPEQRFDNLWAHTLLSDKCYRDYPPPTLFRCDLCTPDKEERERKAKIAVAFEQAKEITPEEEECAQSCYYNKRWDVKSIAMRNALRQREHEARQKLAYDFINRQYPWYMQKPIYEGEYELNEAVLSKFDEPLQAEVLRQIYTLCCRLIIIDVNVHIGMPEMESWLKFCRYARIVAVVRDPLMKRQLEHLSEHFLTVPLQENLENTWQEELCAALDTGVTHAKRLRLLDHCAKCFVFVFARTRCERKLDTYKIMRKF